MSCVLDNSVALAWCFEDEQTPTLLALLSRVAEQGAVAPLLWPLEAMNGLVVAERRQRLDTSKRLIFAAFLQSPPIVLDWDTAAQAWTETAQLAQQHRLTVYDAAYLELARRRTLPLATLDSDLRSAAVAIGVELLGLP